MRRAGPSVRQPAAGRARRPGRPGRLDRRHTRPRSATSPARSPSWPATCARRSAPCLAALQIGDITRQRIEHVQAGLKLLQTSNEARACPARNARARRPSCTACWPPSWPPRWPISTATSRALASTSAPSPPTPVRSCACATTPRAGPPTAKAASCAAWNPASARPSPGGRHRRRRTPGRGSQPLGRRSAQDLAAQIAGIQNMRADVQMMALNTTLKCSRIGETGKPLGVIAVELRAHAGHLETSAARTPPALEGLSASASADEAAAEARGRPPRRQRAARGRGADQARPATRSTGDLAAAAQQGGEVVDMLRAPPRASTSTPGRRLC
jgi:hypothetical protein